MCLVSLLARRGKRGRIFSPAPIGILGRHQPIGSLPHWLAIALIYASTGDQSNQNLSSIEGDRNTWRLIDHPALEGAFWELNSDKPVQHFASAAERLRISCVLRVCDQCFNDVAGRLGIGSPPTVNNAVVPRDTTVPRDRVILCASQPSDRLLDHAMGTWIDGGEPFPVDP